jgi:Helicase HerA, central domain
MENSYEKLGAFYLGREYDLAARQLKEDLVLYDSKDLTTHAVIIGMTGSGKTGLGISLIEEALIDNIPVIAIDPKGDIPNLLLNFPDLAPKDFKPWVNMQDAANKGLTPDQYAAGQAKLWRKGLADWGQQPERIARLKSAADVSVYTPGSTAGLQVSVLRSFSPPPQAIIDDGDLFRDRIQTTTTGLLALLGIKADPITSREHILLSNILEHAWSQGQSLDLAGLIHAIQSPPFERIGVMDLEMFFPPKDRFALAMRLNNLLAAPGFEAWLEGEPLDIGRFLYTPSGKPRAAIFTISHLSDAERMFFVSMLLNEILGWMRSQPGTSSLRAMLYMDEIFGYLPPVANPPSKKPLLTLLKQARAFGLGIALSTQNPVDLDYKGLSNTGTWFIGRLQTERDKDRVLAGLEGAAAGSGFDRGQMEEILAGLGKRVFLLHNVHENQPAIFNTRWALSYLSGPMTRDQIKMLTAAKKSEAAPPAPLLATGPSVAPTAPVQATTPPPAPPGTNTFYLAASGTDRGLMYYPAVAGRLDVHYSNARYKIDTTETVGFAAQFEDGPIPLDWDNAQGFNPNSLETRPLSGAEYAELPTAAGKSSAYTKWRKDLLRWVRQNRPLTLYRSKQFKITSMLGESEGEFRSRLSQNMREKRDLQVEKLRKKYNARFTTLRDRLMRAQQTIDRETEQASSRKMQTAISFGSAILGAFLGRKAVSATSARSVGTAMRSASRMQKENMDVNRAKERAEAIQTQLWDLEAKLQEDIDTIELSFDPETEPIDEVVVKPKSNDITLEAFGLVWIPFRRNAEGRLSPDWE